jgi:hypothetical protein
LNTIASMMVPMLRMHIKSCNLRSRTLPTSFIVNVGDVGTFFPVREYVFGCCHGEWV